MVWAHGFDSRWPNLQAHPKKEGPILQKMVGKVILRDPGALPELLSILSTSLGSRIVNSGGPVIHTVQKVGSYLQRQRGQIAGNGPFCVRLPESGDVAEVRFSP